MSSGNPRTRKSSKAPSQAVLNLPFIGQWSEEGAASVRQRPGVTIGPYKLEVDGADPVSVRAALSKEPFGHLIPDEAIEKLCSQGRGVDLFPARYPTWRYGIDPVTYPCVLVPPTIEELEGIEDKQHLAALIRDLNIRGTTARIRALIRSTVEPDWSWSGETVQDHIEIRDE